MDITFTVFVLDRDGLPVSDTTVLLESEALPGGLQKGQTNSDGWVDFIEIPAGWRGVLTGKFIVRGIDQGVVTIKDGDQFTYVLPYTQRQQDCFIATAAYGSPLALEVVTFRHFRDDVLLRTKLGTALVKAYNRLSPPLAKVIAESYFLRTVVKVVLLKPGLWLLKRRRFITRAPNNSFNRTRN